MEAFYLLSAGRQYGMAAPQPIATSDILALAPHFEPEESITGDGPPRFLRVIRQLDALLLADAARRAESRTAAAEKKKPKPRTR